MTLFYDDGTADDPRHAVIERESPGRKVAHFREHDSSQDRSAAIHAVDTFRIPDKEHTILLVNLIQILFQPGLFL